MSSRYPHVSAWGCSLLALGYRHTLLHQLFFYYNKRKKEKRKERKKKRKKKVHDLRMSSLSLVALSTFPRPMTLSCRCRGHRLCGLLVALPCTAPHVLLYLR